jgi:hypothetical protein
MQNRITQIVLLIAVLALHFPTLARADSSGGPYTLTKQSIAGGGGAVANEGYTAVATTGQSAAGGASGGSFQLISGFHPAPEPAVPDALFQNGFEN